MEQLNPYEMNVGFFMAEEWRYGPLYAFLPVAAVCMAERKPFSMETVGEGRVLAGFDGEGELGDDELVKSAIISIINLNIQELSLIAFIYENKEALRASLANYAA